jgi:hypothetical protein
MTNTAPADVAAALVGDSTGDQERHGTYLGIEDYIERLEGKATRKEGLDPREYYALIASLLA